MTRNHITIACTIIHVQQAARFHTLLKLAFSSSFSLKGNSVVKILSTKLPHSLPSSISMEDLPCLSSMRHLLSQSS